MFFGADTKKDRTKDSIKLIEYSFANYQMVDLAYLLHEEFDLLVENTNFQVDKGVSNHLKMKLENNNIGLYPVHKNLVKDIKMETKLKTNLSAPLHQEDKLRRNKDKNRRKYN